MRTDTSMSRQPFSFFPLVFALSVPFWLIGGLTGLRLLPGLPVSSLMAFCPLLAAAILAYGENKTAGVATLLKRAFDHKRIRVKVWYIPTVLLMPGVMILSYGLLRLTGSPIPSPQFPVLAPLAMFLMFFIAALGEELGWSGYVLGPMQDRWNALQASLLLGLVWAAWHVVPFVQARRSPAWIAWQCLVLVAIRVLLVWLYNNTGGSVFAVAVCHAMVNVTWQLFPVNGSYYDPCVTGLIVILIAAIVVFGWGPRTLARYRYARLRQPYAGS